MAGKYTNIMPAGMEDSDDEEDDFYKDLSVRKTCENLKVTIVPDITADAGLNGQCFDATLEPEIRDWLEQLKSSLCNYKRGPTLTIALTNFYHNCSNPFLFALKLYANCSGINSLKTNSLPYAILEELSNFKTTSNLNPSLYVDDNIRMVAFNFIKKQSQQNIYRMVVRTFNLIERKTLFVDKLRELIAMHFYKEACQLAYELELYEEFTNFDMVFPLILQDKISIAESYLNRAKHLQQPLIELLDSLLDKTTSLQNRCSFYVCKYNYDGIKLSKIQPKPIMKLIIRLAKMYNVSSDKMPNVVKMKSYGALQFLLNKKYQEKCLNKDSWREMVKETVTMTTTDLQLDLINGCLFYGDLAEIVYWSKYFNIKVNDLPVLVQDYIRETQNIDPELIKCNDNLLSEKDEDNILCDPNEIHILALDESNIIIVQNRKQYYDMIQYIIVQNYIAFDAEWKPTFCATTELALIQLATNMKIFLIDVISISIDVNDWNQLGELIFNNNEILKIGFSATNDLLMFQKTIPALRLTSQNLTSYLDLQELWRKLNQMPTFKFPYEGDTQATALNALVKLCLGKQLNKSNQFSNWAKRPLRKEQITYAALDAFCLIEIYNVISAIFQNLGIDFNEYVNSFLMEKRNKFLTKKSNQNTSSSQKTIQHLPTTVVNGPNSNSVSVSEVKFVCDTMLEGLSKSLRKCGIDSISTSAKYCRSDDCIQIALLEKRFLLTKGHSYKKCSQYLPIGHCYQIKSDNVNEQLKEVLLFFNVHVKENNIYSRCQLCNSSEFLYVSQAEMNEMVYGNFTTQKVKHQNTFSTNDWKNRTWQLKNIPSQYTVTKTTSKGAPFQLSLLPDTVLKNMKQFYICEGCGKCYWDGTHFDRAMAGHLKNLVQKN